jgi:wee1-like protein kinase
LIPSGITDVGANLLKRYDSGSTCNSSPSPPTPFKKNSYSRTESTISPGPDIVAGKPSRFEEDFEQLSVLGKGSFGTCYKCVKRLDGCVYAVKRTNRQIRGDIDRNNVLKEVYALSSLCNAEDSLHVVRYFSAWIEDGYLYIQNELCECNLADLVRTGRRFRERDCLDLLRQILLGLYHMHRSNMVHLDIKPEN